MDDNTVKLEDFQEKLKNIVYSKEVNATSLEKLYSMWVNFFFDRIMRIFEWTNLPFPQREIEGSAIMNGITFMAYHDKDKGFVTRNGSVYGVTRYSDMYTTVIYAMPDRLGKTSISGRREIGRDAVVLYNTSNGMSLMPFVERYASLATHIDLTLKSQLINGRYTDILISADSSTQESIKKFYEEKYKGSPSAILDKSLIFADGQGTINLAKNQSGQESSLQLIHSHNELLRSFYRDIGLRVAKEKSAEMTSSEVDANDNMLLFNINDMLRQRQRFCEDCNRIFKGRTYYDEYEMIDKTYQPISVKLNEEFVYNLEGGIADESGTNIRTMASFTNYNN